MKITIDEQQLNHYMDIAEQETSEHYDGQTCSMTDANGDDTCPICDFRIRLKRLLGLPQHYEPIST